MPMANNKATANSKAKKNIDVEPDVDVDVDVDNDNNEYKYKEYIKAINYYKMVILLLARVFPNIIATSIQHKMEPPKYWDISQHHENDLKELYKKYYTQLTTIFGLRGCKEVCLQVLQKCDVYYKASLSLSLTNVRMISMLYEYLILKIVQVYMDATDDKTLLKFKKEALVLDEEGEQGKDEIGYYIMNADLLTVKQNVAKMLTVFLTIQMKNKNLINVTYKTIQDKVFKLKEAEKYLFTDRLKSMTEEERMVDTMFKKNKLGMYNIGAEIQYYDDDTFEKDKKVAENIAKLQKKANINVNIDGEGGDEGEEEQGYNLSLIGEDFMDGDPYGEEYEYDND